MRLLKALSAIPFAWFAAIVIATWGALYAAKACYRKNAWVTETRALE